MHKTIVPKLLGSYDSVHIREVCACIIWLEKARRAPFLLKGALLKQVSGIIGSLVQFSLTFCNGNCSDRITYTIQRSDEHFDWSINGKNQRVRNQCQIPPDKIVNRITAPAPGAAGVPIDAINARAMIIISWKTETS